MSERKAEGTTEISEARQDEIIAKLEPMLRPDVREQGVRMITTLVHKSHSGPLPPPEDFEHYEQTLPGLANRITALTEREQGHRHKMERWAMIMEFITHLFGQSGSLIALGLLLAAVIYMAQIGQSMPSAVIGAIGVIVVGYLQFSARRANRPQQDEKPSTPKPPQRRRKK